MLASLVLCAAAGRRSTNYYKTLTPLPPSHLPNASGALLAGTDDEASARRVLRRRVYPHPVNQGDAPPRKATAATDIPVQRTMTPGDIADDFESVYGEKAVHHEVKAVTAADAPQSFESVYGETPVHHTAKAVPPAAADTTFVAAASPPPPRHPEMDAFRELVRVQEINKILSPDANPASRPYIPPEMRKPYAPCFAAADCWDGDPGTAQAWWLFWGQLLGALGVLLIAPCVRWVQKIIGNWKAHKQRNGESWRFATAPPVAGTLDVKAKFRNAYTKTPASMFAQVGRDAMDRAKDERERKAKQSDEDRWAELATRLHLETAEENGSSVYGEYLAFQKQMRELPQFVMRIRTEAAFLCPTLHPEFVMPMASPTTCRADVTGDSAAICRFLAFSDFRAVFFSSLGLCLLAGAEGTAFYLAGLYHYHYGDAHFEEMVLGLAKNTSRAYTMFVFFPAFMVTGYVLYSAQRWREYLLNAYEVSHAIQDLGLLLCGAFHRPADAESQALFYRVYRYLNVAHLLTHQQVSPVLDELQVDLEFVRMGLLTKTEARMLLPLEGSRVDAVLAWVQCEIENGRRDEVLNIGPINSLGSAIKDCRKKMEGFHEVRWVNQPNSWAALIHFVVYLLLAMVVLGVPIQFYQPRLRLSPFQFFAVLIVYILSTVFTSFLRVIHQIEVSAPRRPAPHRRRSHRSPPTTLTSLLPPPPEPVHRLDRQLLVGPLPLRLRALALRDAARADRLGRPRRRRDARPRRLRRPEGGGPRPDLAARGGAGDPEELQDARQPRRQHRRPAEGRRRGVAPALGGAREDRHRDEDAAAGGRPRAVAGARHRP